MIIGTSIFLSAVLIAFVILFIGTNNRKEGIYIDFKCNYKDGVEFVVNAVNSM
jgi:hypothetical protein